MAKARPPAEGVKADMSGLERLVRKWEDSIEGVDFEAVLRQMKEERKKFLKKIVGEKGNPVKEAAKTKHILYWNSAYGSRQYGFCCGRDPFLSHGCPINDCTATDNRSALMDVAAFDAILFHLRNLNENDLPDRRGPKQRYIMFMLESPAYMMGQER